MAISKIPVTASAAVLSVAETVEHLRQIVEASASLRVAGVDLSGDQTLINALAAEYANTKAALNTAIAALP